MALSAIMCEITGATILLHLSLALLFNMSFVAYRYWTGTFQPPWPLLTFYLPPHIRSLLNRARNDFAQLFPEAPPAVRPVGRPRLPRKPLFLVWLWNRLFLRKPATSLLSLLAEHPALQEFFDLPPTGLKKTTYETFVKEELAGYLEPLIARNVGELLAKDLVQGMVLAGDDFPLESVLNLSKAIDFSPPKATTVHAVFQALGSLDWVDCSVGSRPNHQRGWADYLKLYLLYLLWGFPSQAKFNRFLRKSAALQEGLHLEQRPVQAQTVLGYIRQLEGQFGAEALFQQIFQQVLQSPLLRKHLPANGQPKELGELYGILGNSHGTKDPGARLHYQSSKGRYFFGRIGRILVDTWSQIPLWATVTSAGQPVAWELEAFGQKVTELLADKIQPLLVLFDSGFRGEARWRALQRGFRTVKKILCTRPYKRAKPSRDLFRIERLAVERAIGHLAVHLDLETPPYRGAPAVQGWVLGSVYLQQLAALWNADQAPGRPVTGLIHLQA